MLIKTIGIAMSLITSLPEDIIIDCVSRVPRRYLVPITSLPHTPTFGSYVAVDSKIFVIGGLLDAKASSGNNTLLIDCRFHTARQLPNMPREVASSVSGLINERIYVIGGLDFGCPFSPQGVMDLMVFDIKSEPWESRMSPDMVVSAIRIVTVRRRGTIRYLLQHFRLRSE